MIAAVHESKESRELFRDGTLRPAFAKGINGGFTSSPRESAFSPQMPFFATFWRLDSLHDDPRFRNLLKRMKMDGYFPESPAR